MVFLFGSNDPIVRTIDWRWLAREVKKIIGCQRGPVINLLLSHKGG